MLGVILGFSELALSRESPDSVVGADLGQIRTAAERAAALTRDLLAFASRQVAAPRRLDLNAAVEGSLDAVRRILGEGVELVWSPGRGDLPVRIDPSHLSQMLAALAINAHDAMEGKGRFSIRTQLLATELGETAAAGFVGETVELTLEDSGRGMDPSTLSRAFDPFFTTEEFGKGSGLGLAAVYGIVRQGGGAIRIESEPGKGATFRIRLPRVTGHHHMAAAPSPAPSAAWGSDGTRRTAIIAEDEPALLGILATALERLGFVVLRAGSGEQALRANDAHAGPVDLLVAGVVMPDLGGRALADRLLERHPDLPVLFISGYSPEAVAQHSVAVEQVHFLQKPFSIRDFTAKVEEILEADGTR
jgi:CheY-like chemotaxis protein